MVKTKEKIKKGDRVKLKTRFESNETIGSLRNWKYNKESGAITIEIKPDDGVSFYFLGRKKDFTMEKLCD